MPLLIEEKFNIEATDNEIIETFTGWFHESQTFHDAMLPHQKLAEQYYIGNQTEKDQIPDYLSDTVENRIFEAVETLVPIATANAHKFIVVPGGANEISLKKAETLRKVLLQKYKDLDMQEKYEEGLRKFLLYRFGVMKWGWDDEIDDINVWEIDPRLIYIPKLRVNPNTGLPYVIEEQEYSYNEMQEYFPDVNLDGLSEYGGMAAASDKSKWSRRTYRVFEVWTNEMVAWISSKVVLEKRANPYWDFEGDDVEIPMMGDFLPGKGRPRKKMMQKVFRNHLEYPTKPFVFLTSYRVGDSPVAPISLVEVGIPVADAINVENRQIIDNLRRQGNSRVLIDADAMTKEESDNITNEPGAYVRGEGVASQNKVKFEAGTPLPNAHFAHLQNMKASFDNMMGVHSATRGSAQAKTLGQDILSRQQDFTRVDLVTRVLNRATKRIQDGLIQCMKMYYDVAHFVQYIGEDGAVEHIRLMRDEIEDGIKVISDPGNPIQLDEQALRSEAIQLWQLGAIGAVTLFERLKFPNPEKSAEELLLWKQGQLNMETQAKIQEIDAGARARQSASPEGGSGAAEGRGTESAANVIQRARANLGGTAPVAPGTPNL